LYWPQNVRLCYNTSHGHKSSH